MIQILGLRSFTPKNSKLVTYDKQFTLSFEIPSVFWLFENLSKVLSEIPEDEHWNLFYTVANCTNEKRTFDYTQTLAFDLDGIEHSKGIELYIDTVCKALSLPKDGVGIVSSGNGLHILAHLAKRQGKSFFTSEKPHYKALCNKVNSALQVANLPGNADTAVFEPRRILRLPGTVNRKSGKEEKKCVLYQKIPGVLNYKPSDHSSLPIVSKDEQVSKKTMNRYPKNDTPAVLAGCGFLKHCGENPGAINEPQWYAALSIVARLDNGVELCHQLSSGHPGYSKEETDTKIDQAISASGPRTCDSISQLWDGCVGCPYYQKRENGSPIHIVGPNHIQTEFTGFHHELVDGKGNPKFVPAVEDLLKYFTRVKSPRVLGPSKRVYEWTGTHYKEIEKGDLEGFAREKFNPQPDYKIYEEFRKKAQIDQRRPIEWWEKSVRRKMNFLNGYLDIDTMEFRPHDKEIAFRQVLPYEYDASAKAPTFEKMLRLVTGDDKDLICVLEEFMGYCLSNDDCWAQKALVLPGEGSNGKSTFLDTLKNLAGEDNYASINLAKVDENYNLSQLDGALFNIAEETSPKALRDTSAFKNMVTGGKLLVRIPHKAPYNITNRAKLCITCNQLPESTDNTHGFYRRLLIVPFNQTIETTSPHYDPHMVEKLKGELAGIFNLALLGYHRLKKQKMFTSSKQLEESLEEYRLENDTVLYWVTNYLIVHKNGGFDSCSTAIRDLYASYATLMKSMSRIPVHEQKFYKDMKRIRGDVWGEHPYPSRLRIEDKVVNGKRGQIKVVRGVEISPIS